MWCINTVREVIVTIIAYKVLNLLVIVLVVLDNYYNTVLIGTNSVKISK